MITRLTPVLFAESINAVQPFWGALGFTIAVSVPHGEVLGFAAFEHGPLQIMYQTYASADADVPQVLEVARGSRCFLFLEVADLDAASAAIAQAPVFMPRRRTFYGSEELGVRDPAGH